MPGSNTLIILFSLLGIIVLPAIFIYKDREKRKKMRYDRAGSDDNNPYTGAYFSPNQSQHGNAGNKSTHQDQSNPDPINSPGIDSLGVDSSGGSDGGGGDGGGE